MPASKSAGPDRWLQPGYSFTAAGAQWQTGETLRERAQIRTAQRQYKFASGVRADLAVAGMSKASLAAKIDLGVHQLRRMLAGTAPMPMDVMEAIAQTLGRRTQFRVVEAAPSDTVPDDD